MRIKKAESSIVPLRIVTHNIRFGNPSKLEPHEAPWKARRELIGQQLRFLTRFLPSTIAHEPGAKVHCGALLLCLQEVLHGQLVDVLESLNEDDNETCSVPSWSHVGVGRDDGKEKGEFSPIMYQPRVLRLVHFETKWLSLEPDTVGSKYPDAGDVRIATVAVFEHRYSGVEFIAINTHLDNASRAARVHGISVILATLETVRSAWLDENAPFFLAGDFNSFIQDPGDAYQTLKESKQMVDIAAKVTSSDCYGECITYTGFPRLLQPDPSPGPLDSTPGCIDFIWLGPADHVASKKQQAAASASPKWNVEGYAVLPNIHFDHPSYCSDHRPVIGHAVLSCW